MRETFRKNGTRRGVAAELSLKFSVGSVVELHSLSRADLNGHLGKVQGFHTGRYTVTLHDVKANQGRKVAVSGS